MPLDSESGRWLSEDPIGFSGSNNFFEYAEDSPVRYADPNGLMVWVCVRDMDFPILGRIANHTHFWDDRNHSCCRALHRSQCSEGGHTKDKCKPIKNSDGSENLIMGCCRSLYSDQHYSPFTNDCFTTTDDCP